MDFYIKIKNLKSGSRPVFFTGRFFPVFFARFDGFWAPLGPEVDPEGVPEIACLGLRLEKRGTKGVPKGDQEKHGIFLEKQVPKMKGSGR